MELYRRRKRLSTIGCYGATCQRSTLIFTSKRSQNIYVTRGGVSILKYHCRFLAFHRSQSISLWTFYSRQLPRVATVSFRHYSSASRKTHPTVFTVLSRPLVMMSWMRLKHRKMFLSLSDGSHLGGKKGRYVFPPHMYGIYEYSCMYSMYHRYVSFSQSILRTVPVHGSLPFRASAAALLQLSQGGCCIARKVNAAAVVGSTEEILVLLYV